jgi:MYXO-CTERM domain-containing protein
LAASGLAQTPDTTTNPSPYTNPNPYTDNRPVTVHSGGGWGLWGLLGLAGLLGLRHRRETVVTDRGYTTEQRHRAA